MKTAVMFCLICLACAGGCAGRGVGAGGLSPAPAPPASSDSPSAFAALVAAQPEGAAVPVALTPLGGEALITAGPQYRSGLDSTCRQAVAESAGEERRVFAVCRNADGVWIYVPPIFEATPR